MSTGLTMGKILFAAAVFLVLLEEVISCEYPIMESLVIGGLVLLVAVAWSEKAVDASRLPTRSAHAPELNAPLNPAP